MSGVEKSASLAVLMGISIFVIPINSVKSDSVICVLRSGVDNILGADVVVRDVVCKCPESGGFEEKGEEIGDRDCEAAINLNYSLRSAGLGPLHTKPFPEIANEANPGVRFISSSEGGGVDGTKQADDVGELAFNVGDWGSAAAVVNEYKVPFPTAGMHYVASLHMNLHPNTERRHQLNYDDAQCSPEMPVHASEPLPNRRQARETVASQPNNCSLELGPRLQRPEHV
ncbi:hypothetical protein R3P38DRAFT_2814007 [Favolaschia claudopus]|uniref:Uncharacterized protein n=1 Tax=Favolaschia claudopus TaxID=2862362 RepID=A0AAV9Z490_9AGAR